MKKKLLKKHKRLLTPIDSEKLVLVGLALFVGLALLFGTAAGQFNSNSSQTAGAGYAIHP